MRRLGARNDLSYEASRNYLMTVECHHTDTSARLPSMIQKMQRLVLTVTQLMRGGWCERLVLQF